MSNSYEDSPARLPAAAPFASRHNGPREAEVQAMLAAIGADSLEALTDQTVPDDIRVERPLNLDPPQSEHAALARLQTMAERNRIARSMIGMGYYDTHTPPVLRRNILENPLWYTPYTPYQAEIAQGRLEALLNFQTTVSDLTGLDVANASLLDEPTAAAEAMAMCYSIARQKKGAFLVADDAHPQTLNVMRTRAWSMGIELRTFDARDAEGWPSLGFEDVCGVLVQYPATDGRIEDYEALAQRAHDAGALVVVATDLLALTLLRPPGEFGADIAVGNTQRFGVPMGYGGPHAAFMATHDKHVRKMPGRLVGVSKDAHGNPAYRLAIQTREQHIKRDKATSNICTAQVLLAIMAGMYAVWHGPEGLKRIAQRVHGLTAALAAALRKGGHDVPAERFFDTITVRPAGGDALAIVDAAAQRNINLRRVDAQTVGISLDETTTVEDLEAVLEVFSGAEARQAASLPIDEAAQSVIDDSPLVRTSAYLTHEVFHRYRSETEMMRYLTRLHQKDVSLAQSMIPLGSCTMKLNAAAEMLPITWPEFAGLHPYAPADQAQGYAELFETLKQWLAEITGFSAVSLQPNAGSQGEYAGLLAIRRYHEARGNDQRNVCLIPTSAHGTNPASAVVAGLRVVPVQCDARGNIDMGDLKAKASEHSDQLAAIMVTYPSTHGVFETTIREVCQVVHDHGGQVYLDGANMNAQVGLTRPGDYGADVVHLNLHKTFCIPHGGGGPGMGPIAVAAHLADYLPGDPLDGEGAIAAAGCGSPSILPISWMYIAMMGEPGLTRATRIAMLNANYLAKRLGEHYPVLYTGANDRVAHEFILDCRPFEKSTGVTVEDIAKRMIDFGFHAPTMSWPVPGTLMIEPTESESKQELDRFCDAMIAIREEIAAVERGELDPEDNPLKRAPHTAEHVSNDDWPHRYSRKQAAYPVRWLRERKYWAPVGRIDNPFGDRNLVCSCPPMDEYDAG
ncbi:MAG: aminomethyl-transferring glycine dehydrogenase [Phycisphaeraceae bacterium]